jgi:hypothetical protein
MNQCLHGSSSIVVGINAARHLRHMALTFYSDLICIGRKSGALQDQATNGVVCVDSQGGAPVV